MDYEKKYKEALEKAKKTLEKSSAKDEAKLVVEYFFPELAESDDERIRKELIGMIKECTNWVHKKEYIAYLEKQKDIEDRWIEDREQCFWNGVEEGKMLTEKQKEQRHNIEICPHSIKSKSYSETGYYPIEDCDYGLELALLILEKTIGKVQGFQTDDGIREHQTAIEAVRKAKEQHPSSRFRPGDWVVYDGPLGHAILQVKDVVGGRYTFVDNDSTLLVEDSDEFLRPLTPKDVERPAESRKRNKPKESWLSKAKYEIEHADELLIQSQEELKEIRELKKQEQPDVDLDDDIEMEWDSFSKHLAEYGEESEEVVWLNWNNFNELARYFYELGKNTIKEE